MECGVTNGCNNTCILACSYTDRFQTSLCACRGQPCSRWVTSYTMISHWCSMWCVIWCVMWLRGMWWVTKPWSDAVLQWSEFQVHDVSFLSILSRWYIFCSVTGLFGAVTAIFDVKQQKNLLKIYDISKLHAVLYHMLQTCYIIILYMKYQYM